MLLQWTGDALCQLHDRSCAQATASHLKQADAPCCCTHLLHVCAQVCINEYMRIAFNTVPYAYAGFAYWVWNARKQKQKPANWSSQMKAADSVGPSLQGENRLVSWHQMNALVPDSNPTYACSTISVCSIDCLSNGLARGRSNTQCV